MLDAYAVRKAIPRVLMAAIAINLSIYLCVAALDITKIVADSMSHLLVSPFLSGSPFKGIGIGENVEANSLGVVGILGIGGVLAGAIAIMLEGAVVASAISLLGLLLPLIITVALISLAVLFTLVIRQGLLVFLTVTSPIAIALYILPGTEKYFKQWLDLFFRTLLVYPIIAGIFAMSNVLAIIMLKSAGSSNSGSMIQNFGQAGQATPDAIGALQIIAAILVLYAPLVLIPFSFKLAGGVLASVMNATQSRAQRAGDRLGERVRKSRADENSFLGKNRKRAWEARNDRGMTGAAIGAGVGGVMKAGVRGNLANLRAAKGEKGLRNKARTAAGSYNNHRLAALAEHNAIERKRLDEQTAMNMVKGNDDWLQAMEHAAKTGGGEAAVRDYLSKKEDKDGNLIYDRTGVETGTAAVSRAMSLTSDRNLRKFSSVERAGTGTDYAPEEGGVGMMQQNISEAYGDDRVGAAAALVTARQKGLQAKRVDLAGAGTGGSIAMMEKQHRAGYKGEFDKDAVTDKLMATAIKIKSPGEQASGRGESTRAFATAQKKNIEQAVGEYESIVEAEALKTADGRKVRQTFEAELSAAGNNKEARAKAEKKYRVEISPHGLNTDAGREANDKYVARLANVSGVLDAIGQSSAEAQENLGPVLNTEITARVPVYTEERVMQKVIVNGQSVEQPVIEEVFIDGKAVKRPKVVKRQAKGADGELLYKNEFRTVTGAFDNYRTDKVWRSRKREYGGGEEAEAQGMAREAMEAAGKPPQGPEAGPEGS